MTTLEDMGIREWIETATVERRGVAVAVGRLRAAYERAHGPINKSVWLVELGRAGCKLVSVAGCVLVVDRYLPDDGGAADPAGACSRAADDVALS